MSDRQSEHDRAVIDFAVRNRIATNEIIHHLLLEELSHNSVTRLTARLCHQDWLRGFTLTYPSRYFVPGRRAVSAFGLSSARCLPLGPQSLPTEYAVLEYVIGTRSHALRLKPEEIANRLDWYESRWLDLPHCLRTLDQRESVELLRVDLGGPPDHVARKCLADMRARFELLPFRDCLAAGEFRLVVITCTTEKASQIQASLAAHSWPKGFSIHIAVVRNLIPLMPTFQGAANAPQ
jgi:hypothetical protein